MPEFPKNSGAAAWHGTCIEVSAGEPMNLRTLSVVTVSVVALRGGCAHERTGPTVSGDVNATRSQGSLVGTTGFHFEPYTDLPPVAAPNPVPGSFAGSCVVLGDATSAALRLEIVRNGAQDEGL